MFFKGLFEKYKYNLLNLLITYVSDNRDKIDVTSVEKTESLTINVVLKRKLFVDDKSYKEIFGVIKDLGRLTEKNG